VGFRGIIAGDNSSDCFNPPNPLWNCVIALLFLPGKGGLSSVAMEMHNGEDTDETMAMNASFSNFPETLFRI
jgi:hypothetical protein